MEKGTSPLLREFNEYERRKNMNFDFNVLTTKGVKSTKDLLPGDKLYQFNGGGLLTIEKIHIIGPGPLCQIIYSDGRVGRYVEQDKIYVGMSNVVNEKSDIYKPIIGVDRVANPKDIWNIHWKNNKPFIYQYTTDFSLGGIKISPEPDPYVAGALIAYGDFNDDYINLPIGMDKAKNYISDKYGIDFCQMGDNKIYFGKYYEGTTINQRLRWDEFFPIKDEEGNELFKFYLDYRQNDGKAEIPEMYTHASLNDRWQFIRGVFDIGYTKDVFDTDIGIIHQSEHMLKQIQSILLSMGVLSLILYNPMLKVYRGYEYMLKIVGNNKHNPKFFYDEESIEYNVALDNVINTHPVPDFDLCIAKVFKKPQIGYSYSIEVREGHDMLYTTANYLPRVTY